MHSLQSLEYLHGSMYRLKKGERKMTIDYTNNIINRAYVELDDQRWMLKPHPGEVCNKIGLGWNTALELCDRGWLSFNPEEKTELEEADEVELRFVGTLAACGMDEKQLGMLLKGLRQPYRYRIEKMCFDWVDRVWRLFPEKLGFDEVQDFINTLQRDGKVDQLRDLYQQISYAMDSYQENYRKKIIAGIAKSECKKISRKVIEIFEGMTEGMQSGDDSSLKSIWDEICVQVKGEESVFWNFYLDILRTQIHYEVENLDITIQQAIWLQTNEGIDSEIDNVGNEMEKFCKDDITDYIEKIVLSEAADWTNEGIEKYLEGEYDDPNIG